MRFPCELLSDPYLAQIRQTSAIFLHKAGINQSEIAKLLQVSQPLISNYLKKENSNQNSIQNEISEIAKSVGNQIGALLQTEGVSGTQKAISLGCSNCKIMRQNGIGCLLHKLNSQTLSDDCSACNSTSNIIDIQIFRGSVIQELNEIYVLLLENSSLHYLIPEIGLQIVSGVQNSISINDIAAFPGRIRKKQRGILDAENPTFGSSETLAGLLLQLQQKQKQIATIGAVKSSEWLLEKCTENQLNYSVIQKFDENYLKGIEELYGYSKIINLPFILINEGNVGYEDISYLLCDSPNQLLNLFKILKF